MSDETNEQASNAIESSTLLDVSLGHFLDAKISLTKAARALIDSPLPTDTVVEELKNVIGDLCVTIEILQTFND